MMTQGISQTAAMKPSLPRVLVVDDEQGFRDLMCFELGTQGYQVFTAQDGEEGVRVAKENAVEVVVSDLTMPKMTGLEMLSVIKADDPRTEVIIVTGHATLQTAVDSLKRGAYDYITKPFQVEDLRRLIDRTLRESGLNMVFQGLTTVEEVFRNAAE